MSFATIILQQMDKNKNNSQKYRTPSPKKRMQVLEQTQDRSSFLKNNSNVKSRNGLDYMSTHLQQKSLSSLTQQPKNTRLLNKSPSQFMSDLLRTSQAQTHQTPFISIQSQQQLTSILTNPYKRNNYLQKLRQAISTSQPQIAKNYSLLVHLIKNIDRSSVNIMPGDTFQLAFDTQTVLKQQRQIMRLQRQKSQKTKQIKYVIQEYEQIIKNLTEVTNRLLQK